MLPAKPHWRRCHCYSCPQRSVGLFTGKWLLEPFTTLSSFKAQWIFVQSSFHRVRTPRCKCWGDASLFGECAGLTRVLITSEAAGFSRKLALGASMDGSGSFIFLLSNRSTCRPVCPGPVHRQVIIGVGLFSAKLERIVLTWNVSRRAVNSTAVAREWTTSFPPQPRSSHKVGFDENAASFPPPPPLPPLFLKPVSHTVGPSCYQALTVA